MFPWVGTPAFTPLISLVAVADCTFVHSVHLLGLSLGTQYQ